MPIVTQYQDRSPLVPGLAEIIEVSYEDLPNFFLLHPTSGQMIPYPEPMNDIRDFSPELMLAWARSEALQQEVLKLTEDLNDAEDDPDMDEEEKVGLIDMLERLHG